MSNTIINLYDPDGNKVSPSTGANKTFTIDADGSWTQSGEGYTQVCTVAGMTSTMNGVCGLDMNASDAAYAAACEAQIRVVAQGTNTVTIKVTEKPEVDIPCTIILFGTES